MVIVSIIILIRHAICSHSFTWTEKHGCQPRTGIFVNSTYIPFQFNCLFLCSSIHVSQNYTQQYMSLYCPNCPSLLRYCQYYRSSNRITDALKCAHQTSEILFDPQQISISLMTLTWFLSSDFDAHALFSLPDSCRKYPSDRQFYF